MEQWQRTLCGRGRVLQEVPSSRRRTFVSINAVGPLSAWTLDTTSSWHDTRSRRSSRPCCALGVYGYRL